MNVLSFRFCPTCSASNDSQAERCRACGAGLLADPCLDSDPQARLAALTQHLALVENERATLAAALTRARDEGPGLRSGTFRVIFGGPHGAQVELEPQPIVSSVPAPQLPPVRDRLPPLHVRAAAERAVWEALAGGARVVRIAADAGAGATTLLAFIAAHARAAGFVDGVLRLCDVRGPAADIAQRLAHLARAPDHVYYFPADIGRFFAGMRAVVLLDDAKITASDQAELTQLCPSLRFIIVDSLELPLTPTISLGPLDARDSVTAVEAGYGRRLDPADRPAALDVAASVGALPGRTRLVGVAAAELRRSIESLRAQFGDGAAIISALIASLEPRAQRALGVIALAPSVLNARDIERVVGGSDVRRALERLTDCELVNASDETFYVPRYLDSLVPALSDADAVREHVADVVRGGLEAAAEHAAPYAQRIACETVVQCAFEQSRWSQVLALGLPVADALAADAAFGAWGRILNLVVAAAKREGAGATLDRARHDLGVRSLLLGERHKATTLLGSAARDREAAADAAGAALSAHVLGLVDRIDVAPAPPPPPVAEPPRAAPTAAAPAARIAAPLPIPKAPRRRLPILMTGLALSRPSMIVLGSIVVLVVAIGLWLIARPHPAPAIAGFSTDHATIDIGAAARLCVDATNAAVIEIIPDVGRLPNARQACANVAPATTTTYTAVASGDDGQEARRTVTVGVSDMAAARRLEITQFSAIPARIRIGASTRLCYAVTGADLLRIVPNVGTLVRLRACETVTLTEPHSYTYKLVAIGERGQVAMRHVRIDVIAASPSATATPTPQAIVSPAAMVAPAASPVAVQTAATLHPLDKSTAAGRLARSAVYQFDATPAIVDRGQASSLCVGVGHWARGDVTGIGTLQPGITRCYRVHPFTTTAYRLNVSLDASRATETVTVEVRAPSHAHEIAHDDNR